MSKVVVITGSTRGIGRGLAAELLKRDARVVVSGRSQDAVDKAVAELGGDPSRVAGLACDVTSRADVEALWKHAVAAFGRVDVWVNNAGISLKRRPFWDTTPEDAQAIIDTNLNGVINGSAVAGKGMAAQGSGFIWNMEGFGSGGQKSAGMTAYGSTKRAVTYYTDCAAKDLAKIEAPFGIGHLSPGIVLTDLLVDDYEGQPEEFAKAKKFFNILGDHVETVTPFLAEGILAEHKSGDRVAWLTRGKASGRFFKAFVLQQKRDLFAEAETKAGVAS